MRIRTGLASMPVVFVTFALACSSSPDSLVGSSSAAVGGFPGCSGSFNTQPSPSGEYYATDFGCSSNPYFTDPGDACGSAACIQSAYDEGVCSSGQSNADCQRAVNWYSVGGASYGCGARLQVTNPSNGKSVVVMVLDNGPSCTVENDADFWVLDVSYPTIMYLFGSEEGYSDHARINVTTVGSSTPLGPTTGGTTTADAGYGSCSANGESGQCVATSACSAQGGTSTAGECPGPDNIQCCTGVSSGSSSGSGSGSGGGGASSGGSSSGGSSSGGSSSGGSSSGGSSSGGSSSGGGASCSSDGDCNPGSDGSGLVCIGGKCTPGCDADWECPGNTTCVSGTCQ